MTIINSYVIVEKTYEMSISLLYGFVNEVFSLPTINKYFMPMLSKPEFQGINFKNLFQSYYFSKKVDMNEEEKEEEKKDLQGNLINELQKNERKMFIFANTFELLHSKLINELNAYDIYPVFQVLEATVQHLSKRTFDLENASIDDYIMTTILRN